MTERRIVCAACRHPDGRMVLGVRHFDNLMWQQILSVSALDKVQGQIPDEVWRHTDVIRVCHIKAYVERTTSDRGTKL